MPQREVDMVTRPGKMGKDTKHRTEIQVTEIPSEI